MRHGICATHIHPTHPHTHAPQPRSTLADTLQGAPATALKKGCPECCVVVQFKAVMVAADTLGDGFLNLPVGPNGHTMREQQSVFMRNALIW